MIGPEPCPPDKYYVCHVWDIDTDALTCTCPHCGPGARLRVIQRKTGVTYCCRKCNRGTLPVKVKKDTRDRDQRKKTRLLASYGITLEEFEIRLAAQQGRCLICQDELTRPFVDHCHENGHVRGLLCNLCNSGLGFFRDNPETMKRAIAYLRKYRTSAAG